MRLDGARTPSGASGGGRGSSTETPTTDIIVIIIAAAADAGCSEKALPTEEFGWDMPTENHPNCPCCLHPSIFSKWF